MDGKQGDGTGVPPEEWLTTGEMARLGGTTLRTVRFYEAEGLIASCAREDGCHRKFSPSELKKLQIISDLRDAGLSLRRSSADGAQERCANAKQAADMIATLCAKVDRARAPHHVCTRSCRAGLDAVDAARLRGVQHPEFPTRCAGARSSSAPGGRARDALLWKH